MKADDNSLSRLMALAQQGDAMAYRQLLEQARRWLLGFFSGRVPPHVVDDLVQETLVSVHQKRASFDASRPFYPWLAAFARYRWVDYMRILYRSEKQGGPEQAGWDDAFDDAVLAEMSIDRMLTQISKAQADAIRLVKIQGYSIAEAAVATGQSESLIKVNIHRGLKHLAHNIESI